MSCSNCCFLACIQSSQVLWSDIPIFLRIFQFVVTHTVKGFSRIHVFWNSLAFSMIQQMLAIWSLVPLPFLNPAWTSGSFQFTYCWSLAWRILHITLLACEMSAVVWKFEHSLALPFFWIGMKIDPFQSYGHCWVSKFAGILSAALSQHHLLGFEIAQLKFHHLH